MTNDNTIKQILVLARDEPVEAMRVAAGLTIVGHSVDLVFMSRALTDVEAGSEHGELLELCDIEPMTTVPQMQAHFPLLDSESLATQLKSAHMVINL